MMDKGTSDVVGMGLAKAFPTKETKVAEGYTDQM